MSRPPVPPVELLTVRAFEPRVPGPAFADEVRWPWVVVSYDASTDLRPLSAVFRACFKEAGRS